MHTNRKLNIDLHFMHMERLNINNDKIKWKTDDYNIIPVRTNVYRIKIMELCLSVLIWIK